MPVNIANKLYPPVQVIVTPEPPQTPRTMLYLIDVPNEDEMLFLNGDMMEFLGE